MTKTLQLGLLLALLPSAQLPLAATAQLPPVEATRSQGTRRLASRTTTEDEALAILLPASDPDGDPLSYTIVTPPKAGMVTGLPPALTYQPDPDFYGTDSFTFQVSDGTATSNVATVAITVTPVNDPPTAADDTYESPGPIVDVTAPGVLRNDGDPEGDPLHAYLVTGPDYGTVDLRSDGSFTYTPGPAFTNRDAFTYRAGDGLLFSQPAAVTILTGEAIFWDGFESGDLSVWSSTQP